VVIKPQMLFSLPAIFEKCLPPYALCKSGKFFESTMMETCQ
jgi:hypothetical protein